MKSRVLLIYPPTKLINREDRCQVPTGNVVVAPPLPPTDLMYMASVAEAGGSTCMLVDYTLDDLPLEKFIEDLSGFRPDYLVISTTTPTLSMDLKVCTTARQTLPRIKTIAKGAHFLRFNTTVLEDFPDLDMIIRGEAEATLGELLHGTDPREITGLTWRGPEGIINNPERAYSEDLDTLPFPARHLVDNSRYVRPDNGRVQGVIKVARGCPYDCFFCLATAVSGKKVRRRSPGNILEEVKLCMEKYGMRDFLFWSDIFNLDRNWVVELCRAIMSSGLEFNWATNTRPDTMDPEMAEYMRKAGCTLVSIGIESGNQEVLDKMGKKVDLDEVRKNFGVLKKAGLKTFAYYVVGLPWETRETFEDTVRLAIELDSDFANFFTATAFPGTRFFEYAVEQRLFDTEGADLGELFKDAYHYPTVKGHHLGQEEIARLHEEAVRRFFLRPGYILKSFFRIRSLKELYNYSRAALAIIRH